MHALSLIPLLKIAAAFLAILICINRRLPLWLSILAGAVVLILAFGLAPGLVLTTAIHALIDPGTLFLVAIIDLILVFSYLIEVTGLSRRLLDSLSGALTGPRLRLIFFPALLGLLPMPGGAVFSAPMVKTAADGMELSTAELSLINYWFRHIWELCWPLFPGLLLASSLTGIPLANFAVYQIPGSLACIALGWLFLLRPLKLPPGSQVSTAPKGWQREALHTGLPLIVAIFGSLGLQVLISVTLPGWHSEWGVVAGILAAVAMVAIIYRVPVSRLAATAVSSHVRSMILVIAAIYIFKDLLTVSGAVEALSALATGPAALIIASVLLPFVVGIVAGLNMAFVGTSFPVILAMMEHVQVGHPMAYLVLAYFSGFVGVMASPLHVCFLLTCQYFGAELAVTWRRLALPCLGLMGVAAAYFALLRA